MAAPEARKPEPTPAESVEQVAGTLIEATPDPALLEAFRDLAAAMRDVALAVRELRQPRLYERFQVATGTEQAIALLQVGFEMLSATPVDLRSDQEKARNPQAGPDRLKVVYTMGLPRRLVSEVGELPRISFPAPGRRIESGEVRG